MKTIKLLMLTIISFIIVSCASTANLTYQRIDNEENIAYVLSTYYPQLYQYYDEGVLKVNSIKEVVLENNIIDYKIKYKFVRRYYYNDYAEMAIILKEHFPELYDMYTKGIIEINSIYKYVDRDTGRIRYHVSYRNIYDTYYNIYHGPRYRGYYRPNYRATPPPPRHRTTPPPQHKPAPAPKPQGGTRPGGSRPSSGGRRR